MFLAHFLSTFTVLYLLLIANNLARKLDAFLMRSFKYLALVLRKAVPATLYYALAMPHKHVAVQVLLVSAALLPDLLAITFLSSSDPFDRFYGRSRPVQLTDLAISLLLTTQLVRQPDLTITLVCLQALCSLKLFLLFRHPQSVVRVYAWVTAFDYIQFSFTAFFLLKYTLKSGGFMEALLALLTAQFLQQISSFDRASLLGEQSCRKFCRAICFLHAHNSPLVGSLVLSDRLISRKQAQRDKGAVEHLPELLARAVERSPHDAELRLLLMSYHARRQTGNYAFLNLRCETTDLLKRYWQFALLHRLERRAASDLSIVDCVRHSEAKDALLL